MVVGRAAQWGIGNVELGIKKGMMEPYSVSSRFEQRGTEHGSIIRSCRAKHAGIRVFRYSRTPGPSHFHTFFPLQEGETP